MEHYLKQEELFYVLEKRPEEEEFANLVANATAEQEREREIKFAKRLKDDRAAINDLFMALDDDPMAHVFQCTFAKEVIDKLDGIFQPKGPVAMLGLRSKLCLLKNENFESLQKLFSSHEGSTSRRKKQ